MLSTHEAATHQTGRCAQQTSTLASRNGTDQGAGQESM
jgi:hypothetical protein